MQNMISALEMSKQVNYETSGLFKVLAENRQGTQMG